MNERRFKPYIRKPTFYNESSTHTSRAIIHGGIALGAMMGMNELYNLSPLGPHSFDWMQQISNYPTAIAVGTIGALASTALHGVIEKPLRSKGLVLGNRSFGDAAIEPEKKEISMSDKIGTVITAPIMGGLASSMFPTVEEHIFRQGGAEFFNTGALPADMNLLAGGAIALFFAYCHNVNLITNLGTFFDKKPHKFTRFLDNSFNLKTLPIAQFAGGLAFWYLFNTYGLSGAIIGHAAWNASAYLQKVAQTITSPTKKDTQFF